MERYKLVNNKAINNILLYIIIFATIIFSRDTLITSLKLGFYKSFFINLFIISIMVGLILINSVKNKRFDLVNIRKIPIINIAIFTGLIIITSVIKLDFQMYILSIIFYIFVAYLFIMIFTFEDFFEKFSNIMVFLSIISLIMCYAFRNTLLFPSGVVNNNIPTITNSVGTSFFDFGLTYVVSRAYYIRNFGLFREPGVYQFFLLVPLIYELLIKRKNIRYFNIIILIVTVISTFSLAGIIIMGLLILTYIINIILEGSITKKLLISIIYIAVIGSSVIILLYFNNTNFSSIINESFKKLTTVNQSSSARIGSVITNIELFLRSPIWGNDFAIVQYASAHNTNSTMSIFSIFGIIVGTLHIWYIYVFTGRSSNKKSIRILLSLLILLLINSQFLLGNTMFWIIMFSVFMLGKDSDKECEELEIKILLNRMMVIKNKIFRKK